jgi:6-phosphogluconolactonase (cycloisomerase 2 family)
MISTTRTLLLVSGIVAALFLTGCGKGGCPSTTLTSSGGITGSGISTGGTVCGAGTTGGGGGSSSAFLFYIDPTANTVNTLSFSTTGNLSSATGLTPPATSGVVTDDMTVVNKQFVYIPFGDINAVQALSINSSSGGLTPVTGSPFALPGGTADSVIADPTGRFLFVGSEGIGSISVFQIASDGSLTLTPGSPFTSFNLFSADSLAVDGTGKFLYVGQLDPTIPIEVFTIDQNTGALSELGPFNLGVAQLHADPSGKFLLGTREIADTPGGFSADATISVFSIDPATGAPSPIAGSPFATAATTFDFAISPNDQFVYVLEYNAGFAPLEGFPFNSSTGVLGTSTVFSSLSIPTLCKFDQGGGALFCDTGASFVVFAANSTTGALSSTTSTVQGISYLTFAWAVTD